MTDYRTRSLADLALTMGLTPAEAVALPTVIEVAARKVGWTETTMLWETHKNAPLRDYLGGLCRKAIEGAL